MTCRSCGRPDPPVILSLGPTPLANALRSADELAAAEPRYPLDLAVCPACSLAQITETVPPEILFRDYVYRSSFSDTMLAHARELVARMIRERGLGPGHLAVELASNDGYLLKNYRGAGVPVLGIEPARNIARIAVEEHGVPTLAEFFGEALAGRLAAEGRRADVLHAHNVLAHVADLNGFVRGIARILRDTGVAVIEVPWVVELVDRCEFDTIYHEHLCYFSMTALAALFERHGLTCASVERLALHGGSLRLFIEKQSAAAGPADPSVTELLEYERRWGIDDRRVWDRFAGRVGALRERLTGLLADLKASGARLAAYGASAKGATLLNTFGIGRETLDFIVDRSTVKQGLFSPGAGLPILPTEALVERQPDVVLLLTWNFAEEIFRQQRPYLERGGRFLVPLPEPRLVGAAEARGAA